jgi:hypothetical protein
MRVAVPEQVDRGYVRRRAGAEWFFRNRPLDVPTLIESIEEDFQVRILVEEARELFARYIDDTTCLDRDVLEQEFIRAMRELGLENPEFVQRLKGISIEQLLVDELGNGFTQV